MKRVALIGIVGLPANYGGFESFAEQLVQRLWDEFDITVFCQHSAYKDHPCTFGKVRLLYLPLKANGVWSIFYDMLAMLKRLQGIFVMQGIRQSDIDHIDLFVIQYALQIGRTVIDFLFEIQKFSS